MRTIAVTSGKGGVGKTNISANLGIALAQAGKRVVLFDADIGLANLDVVLGTKAMFTLQHVFSNERRLAEVLQEGPAGIHFVAGGSGVEALISVNGPRSEEFLSELSDLANSTDFLIFDTGAGIDSNVMTFLQAADETLLVTTPDPASITDSYATAKALLRLKPDATIKVLMNMVDDERQARSVAGKLQAIAQQFIGKNLDYAGHVRLDPKAVSCIRLRKPFVLAEPQLPASKDVLAICQQVLGQAPSTEDGPGLVGRLRSLFSFGQRAA